MVDDHFCQISQGTCSLQPRSGACQFIIYIILIGVFRFRLKPNGVDDPGSWWAVSVARSCCLNCDTTSVMF